MQHDHHADREHDVGHHQWQQQQRRPQRPQEQVQPRQRHGRHRAQRRRRQAVQQPDHRAAPKRRREVGVGKGGVKPLGGEAGPRQRLDVAVLEREDHQHDQGRVEEQHQQGEVAGESDPPAAASPARSPPATAPAPRRSSNWAYP